MDFIYVASFFFFLFWIMNILEYTIYLVERILEENDLNL